MANAKIDPRLIDRDDMINRNRDARKYTFAAIAAASVCVPALIGWSAVGWISAPLAPFGAAVGVLIGGKFLSKQMRKLIISVPQATTYVTVNPLLSLIGKGGDPNISYGPGEGFSFPWEERGAEGNLSTQIITIEWTEEVPGKNGQLLVKGSLQFKVDIANASSFIGVDESTIRGGIIDIIKAKVSTDLSSKTIDQAKAKIEEMNRELTKIFSLGENNGSKSDFEKRYGIEVVAVTITGIDNPPKTQDVLDSLAQAEQVGKGIANMLGISRAALKQKIESGAISVTEYNEMIDRWFVQSGKAPMNVTVFKGLEGAAKVLGAAMAGKGKGE